MNKVLNIFGFIIGLIGLVIGIMSYIDTIKSKELCFNVYSPSYKIFDNEAIKVASSLNIFTSDTIKIDQNIYLTTFSIWNSGDLPIKKEDIRKSLSVHFTGIHKIISYKIIKEVEEGSSEIKFISKNDSIFDLDWKYFDPKNGIKVQILYLGEDKIKCQVEGRIFETKFIEFIPIQNLRNGAGPYILIMTIMAILTTLFSINIYVKMFKRNNSFSISIDFFISIILPVLYILLCFFMLYARYFMIQEIPF